MTVPDPFPGPPPIPQPDQVPPSERPEPEVPDQPDPMPDEVGPDVIPGFEPLPVTTPDYDMAMQLPGTMLPPVLI